jgi:hypothetical protein
MHILFLSVDKGDFFNSILTVIKKNSVTQNSLHLKNEHCYNIDECYISAFLIF